MIRTHTVRLYPNKRQEQSLLNWLWCCRRLWNNFLEQRIKAYERRKEAVSYFDQSSRVAEWRARDEKMADCAAIPLREAARRLERAFAAFFRRLKAGEKPGFPRFKGRDRMRSLEFAQPDDYVRHGRIRVPKLGLLRCRNLRVANGQRIQTLRILLHGGRWFAQLVVKDDREPPAPHDVRAAVGIDVGINAIVAMSTGEIVANPRHLERAAKQLSRKQRWLSRKSRGSRNRKRFRQRVSRAYGRVTNCRKDFLHKLSKEVVQRFDLIAVEHLSMKGLVGSRLAGPILAASWGFLRHCLAYKAESAGVRYVEVDPSGTSQECSECGQIVKKALSVRVHNCDCGCVLDRDVNAARNILKRAAGRAVSACGGLALAGPLKQEES